MNAATTKGLKGLSIKRLATMVSSITSSRVKRYKDKASAIKALGNPSKQALVRALIQSGGASAQDISSLFTISTAYARDIISKLTLKGEGYEKAEDGKFYEAV